LKSIVNFRRFFRIIGHLILAGHCLKEVSTEDGQAHARARVTCTSSYTIWVVQR